MSQLHLHWSFKSQLMHQQAKECSLKILSMINIGYDYVMIMLVFKQSQEINCMNKNWAAFEWSNVWKECLRPKVLCNLCSSIFCPHEEQLKLPFKINNDEIAFSYFLLLKDLSLCYNQHLYYITNKKWIICFVNIRRHKTKFVAVQKPAEVLCKISLRILLSDLTPNAMDKLISYRFQSIFGFKVLQYFHMKKKESTLREDNHSKLQQLGKDDVLESNQHHFDQYQICRPYPNETNRISNSLVMTVRSLFPLSVAIAYLLLARPRTPFVKQLTTFILAFKSSFQTIALLCIIFLKITVAVTILLDSKFYQVRGVHKLLQQLIEWLRSYLRISVQLDFFSSSLLLIATNVWSIAFFVLSIIIIGFSLIFLENYSSRKDDFYIGSVNFYVLMRLNVLVGSITNVLCLISQSQIAMYCFLTVHSMFAIFLTATYCSQGFIIYRDPILKWGVFFLNFLYLALVCIMIIELVINSNLSSVLINIVLSFLVISLYFYHLIVNIKMKIVTEKANLKLETYYLLQILEQSHQNEEVQAFVNGTLMMHGFTECSNPMCYIKSELLYDSKTRLYCSTKDDHKNRVSLMKFYIKCKFQQFLNANPDNFDTMISYSQFLYNNFNNVGLSLYWARQVSQNRSHLGLSEKLKFNGLIRKICTDNKRFCNIVYGSNLEIENLIQAESVNQNIMSSILEIIQQKIELERLLQDSEIDLSEVRLKVEEIMQKTEENLERWKEISNFVQRSKHWKIQYICFAVFLKNEKLSRKILQSFGSSLQNQKDNIFIIQSGTSSIAIDLFDINSCCIHTEIRQGNVFIKKVSRTFTNLTEYSNEQIINADIAVLMPNIMAAKHKQMLLRMSKEGKFSNQNNYFIKQVYIINKRGLLVPVLKIYKEFVTVQGELEYVCFLKRINQLQSIILCDQNMQIVGITEKCSRLLTQDIKDQMYIRNLNILSLIPQLAGLTKFKDFAKKQCSSAAPIQSVRYVSCLKSQDQDTCEKLINANNHPSSICHKPVNYYELAYPQAPLSELAQQYHNLVNHKIDKNDLQTYYQCIEHIAMQIKRNQHYVFNCKIEMNQVHSLHGMDYFEVKLNRIHLDQPESSTTINPRRHDNTKNFKDLVDSSNLPQAFDKGEIGLANISENTNIFIKNDVNQTPKSNAYIKAMKWIWTLLFVLLIPLLMFSVSLYEKQYHSMGSSLKNINSAGQLSIISSRLINLYIAKSLHFPNFNSSLMTKLTQEFKDIMNSASLHQAIFDPIINPPNMYYPNSNNITGFNHLDLFFFADSSFSTLSSSQFTTESQQYKQLMDYQFPALNTLLNQTKIHLDSQFNKYKDILNTEYIAFFTSQIIALAASIIATAVLSYNFFKSMIEMMNIHCQFSQKDITNITLYHNHIMALFQNLQHYGQKNTSDNYFLQKKTLFHTNKQSDIKNDILQNSNMNKRSKKIAKGRAITRQKGIYFIKIVSFFAILITATISRNLYFSSLTTYLVKHEYNGEQFLIFVPARYLTAQIVAHAYQHSILPDFHPSQYQLLLSILQTIMNKHFIEATQGRGFSETVRQFYYTDCCQISVEALSKNNITLEECQQAANHSLKVGLRQYTRYEYYMIKEILNGQRPSFLDLQDYFRSIDIYHAINDYVIDSWAAEYKDMISQATSNLQDSKYLALAAISVMVVAFMQLYNFLRKEFRFYCYFYANMMPEYIVSRQKIIHSNLAEINFR